MVWNVTSVNSDATFCSRESLVQNRSTFWVWEEYFWFENKVSKSERIGKTCQPVPHHAIAMVCFFIPWRKIKIFVYVWQFFSKKQENFQKSSDLYFLFVLSILKYLYLFSDTMKIAYYVLIGLGILWLNITAAKTLSDDISQEMVQNALITIQNNNQTLKNEVYYSLSLLTEKIIQKEIKILSDLKYISQEDLEVLSGNINLVYFAQYGKNYGNFQAIKQHNQINLKNITFNINLFSSEIFLNDFVDDVRRILIHELGHYVSYQNPTLLQKFNKICKKNSCKKKDYVSSYAFSSPEEDFAETFAYRYFQRESHNKFYKPVNETDFLKQKLNLLEDWFA